MRLRAYSVAYSTEMTMLGPAAKYTLELLPLAFVGRTASTVTQHPFAAVQTFVQPRHYKGVEA